MSEEKFETIVFKGKTFGKLLEEIHTNSRENDKLIAGLIEDFKDNVELNNLGDVIQLANVLSPYIKMSIDNNDHVIKLASIVQKSLEKSKAVNEDVDGTFSEEDKKQLEELMLEYDNQPVKLLSESTTTARLPSKTSKLKNKHA